jgi:hypothetical protein
MNSESPPFFLQQLNLGLDADVRAIRSAYARAVKKIDLDTEADTFQDLREAYETALRWATSEQDAGTVVQAAPPLPLPLDPHNPQVLANHALDRLALAIASLSQGPALDDAGLWTAQLQARLEDDELINISARALFEAGVANLLVNHWAPGNVTLFAAAIDVFGWQEDRSRLWSLGQPGQCIDYAIDERRYFQRQLPAEHLAQIKVINRLRAPGPARLIQVRRDLPVIFRMLERVPNWLAISADRAVIERWRAMAPEVTPTRGFQYADDEGSSTILQIVYALMLLVFFLTSCN